MRQIGQNQLLPNCVNPKKTSPFIVGDYGPISLFNFSMKDHLQDIN